jgi:hypothetical protein
VIKKKNVKPLAIADPWRGLGVETPPHQGSLVGANPIKITLKLKEFQSFLSNHGGPGHPLRHECKLQMKHTSSLQHAREGAGASIMRKCD